METYNEKLIKLYREIREKREAAFQAFNTKRQQLLAEKQKAGQTYDEEKKRLQKQLNELLSDRLKMRADGIGNTHAEMRMSYENERRIQEMQSANRMQFFDAIRENARQQNTNTEEYRAEKLKISNYQAERLLQIEQERKELLSLNDEKEKD
jgi:hypothetical protein